MNWSLGILTWLWTILYIITTLALSLPCSSVFHFRVWSISVTLACVRYDLSCSTLYHLHCSCQLLFWWTPHCSRVLEGRPHHGLVRHLPGRWVGWCDVPLDEADGAVSFRCHFVHVIFPRQIAADLYTKICCRVHRFKVWPFQMICGFDGIFLYWNINKIISLSTYRSFQLQLFCHTPKVWAN